MSAEKGGADGSGSSSDCQATRQWTRTSGSSTATLSESGNLLSGTYSMGSTGTGSGSLVDVTNQGALTDSSNSNSLRSSSVEKPYSVNASSRTARCVYNVSA